MKLQKRTKQILVTAYTLLVLFVPATTFSLPVHAAACAALPTDNGSASASFTVAMTGTYRLWAHTNTPTSGGGTLDLVIDNNCPTVVDGNTSKKGAFNWSGFIGGTQTPIIVNLTAGSHNLTLAGQDPGVGVDEILLLTNSSCVPIGDGGNCTTGTTVTVNTPKTAPKARPSQASAQHQKPSIIKVVTYLAIVICSITLIGLVFRRYVNRLFGRVLAKIRPRRTARNPNIVTFRSVVQGSSAKHRYIILCVVGICIIVASLAAAALADTNQSIVISLANARVSGQAKLVPNANTITGYLVQFGQGSASSRSATSGSGTPSSTSGSAPSSRVAPGSSANSESPALTSGSGAITPSGDVTCSYQDDTWSGDAPSVGYSVAKLSASDGNPASFSVRLNGNSDNTEVVGYPSEQCLMYSALPANLVSSYVTTPPPASGGLDYEFAYDIWLTTAAAATSNNWDNDLELMIWTYNNGQTPAGVIKGSLSDGSQVWVDGNDTTGVVSVVLPSNTTSGTVNVSTIVSQLKARGFVSASYDGILDMEYGVEAPYGGGQVFTVNSFAVGK